MTGKVDQGALAKAGLLTPTACEAAEAVLARVSESKLETVRVLFADQHGILRGKTLVASAMASVFDRGVMVPSTLLLKDTSHRTAFPVWSDDPGIRSGPMQGANDVLLVPDPGSFRILPWSAHSAVLLCDVVFRDGTPIPFAPRQVLQTAVDRLTDAGMAARFGLEVEFQIFEIVDARLAHGETTMPPRPPETRALTRGHQYLTETEYAAAEDVLDLIRRNAQGLGLPVRSVEIEMGPSQYEVTFDPAAPTVQAETYVLFRTMVKELCAARGLHATFMAKPRVPNAAANGWHIHQSIEDLATGRNLFVPPADGALSPQARGWLAGLLVHASESCLLTSPTVNGYKRFAPYQLAPNRVVWGRDNRGAMLRALMAPGDPASRIENRAPDTTANPYFALAAQILGGLSGVTQGLEPPAPTEAPYDGDAPALPTSLAGAIEAFERSELYRGVLGDDVVDYLVRLKKAEWDRYLADISEWEQAEYFNLF